MFNPPCQRSGGKNLDPPNKGDTNQEKKEDKKELDFTCSQPQTLFPPSFCR
jgi:hypothetical protein